MPDAARTGDRVGKGTSRLLARPARRHDPPLISTAALLSTLALQGRFERLAQVSMIVLAVIATFATLYVAKSFFLPTMLGIVVALIATPISYRLERWGLPARAAAGVTVLLLILGIAVAVLAFLPALQEWGARIPEIAAKLKEELRGLRHLVATMESASEKVRQSVESGSVPAGAPRSIVVSEKGIVSQLVSTAPALLAQIVYTLLLAFFLIAERRGLRKQLLRTPRSFVTRLRLARTIELMRHNVSTYLFRIATINVGLGVLSGLMLFGLGVPSAGLWGLGVAIANFVPYVGPFAMQFVVFGVSFVTFDSIQQAIIPAASLMALNFIEGNLVTPALVGRRARLRPVGIFVAVAFGAWIWGIGGAVVAVPITIMVVTLFQYFLILPVRPGASPPPLDRPGEVARIG